MRWHCTADLSAHRLAYIQLSLYIVIVGYSLLRSWIYISILQPTACYRHTHFFSASLWPTRVATWSSVPFNTSFDTFGNLFLSAAVCPPAWSPAYLFFSTSTTPVLLSSLPSTTSLNSAMCSGGNGRLGLARSRSGPAGGGAPGRWEVGRPCESEGLEDRKSVV